MARRARPTVLGRWLGRKEVPEEIVVEVRFDKETEVYYVSRSTLRGLHVEAETLDEMQREIGAAVAELLADHRNDARPDRDIIMKSAVPCVA